MSITAQNIAYQFANGEILFHQLNFSLGKEKTGLVGPNGIGKSTLLDLISKSKQPTDGSLQVSDTIFRLPQNFRPFYPQTIQEVLGINKQLNALKNILGGTGTDQDYVDLNEEWTIEERVESVLKNARLANISLDRKFDTLSGGEMSRLLFAKIVLQQPDFVLLDEPTNHLDLDSRQFFYEMIASYEQGMLIVSHDRELLRRMDQIMELSSLGVSFYGGNFDFYQEQKQLMENAKQQALHSAETTWKKNVVQQEKKKRSQEKRQSKGKKAGIQSNIGKMGMNYLKNKSEQSTSKLKSVHEKQVTSSQQKINSIKSQLKTNKKITIDLEESSFPKGKRVLLLEQVNFAFSTQESLWKFSVNFEIKGPQRWSISGSNGAGKTTLLQLILGNLQPKEGKVTLGTNKIGFIDQQLLLLKNELSILENVQRFNTSNLSEGDLRIRLARFLFFKEEVHKKAAILSGGERMRAGLACLLATNNAPELLILDEPTNNLDLDSVTEIINALTNFKGALIVIAHDVDFLKDIGITHQLVLDREEEGRIEILK